MTFSSNELYDWKTTQTKKQLNQCLFKVGYMPHPIIYKRVQVKEAAQGEEQYYLMNGDENEKGQFLLKASLIHEEANGSLLVFETFDNRSEEHRYTPSHLNHRLTFANQRE